MQKYPRLSSANVDYSVATHYILQQKTLRRLRSAELHGRGNRDSHEYLSALEDKLFNMTLSKIQKLQSIENEAEFVAFIFEPEQKTVKQN